MSAFPDSEIVMPMVGTAGLSRGRFAALATVFAVLGLSTIWPTVYGFWVLWTTDALKSIGMVIPLVSLILILRVWKTLGWEAEGTWWGLVVLLVTTGAVWVQQRSVLILVVSPHWSAELPPRSLVLLAYGSGVVLLFGGTRLYRAALFPILLLWFANPIPHVFSSLVDLPLQRISAHIARAFAMHLGQPLTPDRLRLMFTPNFGMFIAPGCNGIRGSMTMGFIALIAGYIYRFRWYASAAVVAGAVFLGYVFNLARLCLLVVYYVVALHFTSLQNQGENADYVIGATLFLFATLLLFTVIHRLRETNHSVSIAEQSEVQDYKPRFRYGRLGAMAALAVFGWAGLGRAVAVTRPSSGVIADAAVQPFPPRLGNYTLVRSWNETEISGSVIYVWAQYAPVGGGTPIAMGVSPVLGWHDPLICHSIRGENPLWQGPLTILTADVSPISFSSAFYNNGVTQYLDASTQCGGGTCGEFATQRTHLGFVYTHPDAKSLLSGDPKRPIPVLLRVETTDTKLQNDAARLQLTEDLRDFLAHIKIEGLLEPYNR